MRVDLVAVGTIIAACALATRPMAQSASPAAVVTHHNDAGRSGVNAGERTLNRTNLDTLHRSGGFKVDGQIYAQPLFVPDVVIGGQRRSVLYVATMRNYVYAYDADASAPDSATALWQVGPSQIGDPVPFNFRHLTWEELGINVHDSFGITSTPVIDPDAGALWLVAKTLRPPSDAAPTGPRTTYWLHKLSLADGHALHAPVEIVATVEGTGSQSEGGQLAFDPDLHLQRAALLLSKGSIYIGFGSHQDTPGFHGWMFRYAADDLVLQDVLCTTPDGKEGGIWQAGAGPAADSDGNVFVMTGNGTFNTKPGHRDYGMAFVKMAPDLNVLSTFAPTSKKFFQSRWFLNFVDADLGASGPAMLSDALMVGGGKAGRLFLVGSSANGLKHVDDAQVTPKLGPPFIPPFAYYHIHGVPVVWHAAQATYVFVWPEKTPLISLTVDSTGATTQLKPCPKTKGALCRSDIDAPPHSMPGGMLSLSTNGSDDSTAILWASLPKDDDAFTKDVAGVLYAFNPFDLRRPLWSNRQQSSSYLFAKYCPPTVANGRVYLATFSGTVDVYDR